jgi:predicted TPR repeat methyltransferase
MPGGPADAAGPSRPLDAVEARAAAGDAAGAAEALAAALREAPLWGAGWYRLGELRELSGEADAAAAAFAEALRLDPADRLGAGPRLAAMGRRALAALPSAFVEALFDSYAGQFDGALVGALRYRGPEVLAAMLPDRRFGAALDLGCGTGLAGAALRGRCDRLEGWDISARMLEQAAEKRVYDALERVDLAAPPAVAGAWDLVVAADVFTYTGPMEPLVAWSAAALRPGGVLAFCVEAGAGDGVTLGRNRRFRFPRGYLRAVLGGAGFGGIQIHGFAMRQERGVPVDSFVGIACVPGGG